MAARAEDNNLSTYRQEAIEHYHRGQEELGAPLRLKSPSLTHSYRALIAIFVLCVLFLLVGQVGEFASGPAVVHGSPAADASAAPVDDEFTVSVLIPGQYQPQVMVGMPLRLELAGYPYAYQWATIDEVGKRVMSPTEARRIIGPDAHLGSGPVFLVTAHLPSPTFVIDDRLYHYSDGMVAGAELLMRRQPIILMLPGLRRVIDRVKSAL